GDGVQLDELFRVTNGNGWTVSARAGPGPIDNALRHFADHGAEFGARDPLDYVRQAQDFLHNPPGNALTKVRPNFDVVRFDPTTEGARRFRQQWIEAGAKWSRPDRRPADWNLEAQLRHVPAAFR